MWKPVLHNGRQIALVCLSDAPDPQDRREENILFGGDAFWSCWSARTLGLTMPVLLQAIAAAQGDLSLWCEIGVHVVRHYGLDPVLSGHP